jgi:hypothetical protein
MFLPLFERLKLLDCSCVSSHLRIPYDYRNGIGSILNVSFCSLCLFCMKVNKHKKNLSHGKRTKNQVFDGFFAIYGNELTLSVSACAKFKIPER